MHFEAAVQYLLGLGNEVLTMKLGLRNTELLLESLNHPEHSYPSVQIAGTNGKGSVTAMLDSICRHAGIRTGRYASPHLSSITERITIDGKDISRESFATQATLVRDAAERLTATNQIAATPTFFEQITTIAFSVFRETAVDLAILETGLGGRLDSTSVANAALVGITSIDFDHQQYLGNTLAEIAAEKAAIIRPGVMAVVGPQQPEALKVIMERCNTVEVTPAYGECETLVKGDSNDGRFCVTIQTPEDTYKNLWLGLRGKHQIENATIAIQLAEKLRTLGFPVTRDAIAHGLKATRHPGRLELITNTIPILLDGAHNPAGALALREHLEQFAGRPLTLVFGCMSDKQVDEIANALFPVADRLILTPISNPRSAPVAQLHELARRVLPDEKITIASSAQHAIEIARAQTPELICVTGSLYLIGEVRPHLLAGVARTEKLS